MLVLSGTPGGLLNYSYASDGIGPALIASGEDARLYMPNGDGTGKWYQISSRAYARMLGLPDTFQFPEAVKLDRNTGEEVRKKNGDRWYTGGTVEWDFDEDHNLVQKRYARGNNITVVGNGMSPAVTHAVVKPLYDMLRGAENGSSVEVEESKLITGEEFDAEVEHLEEIGDNGSLQELALEQQDKRFSLQVPVDSDEYNRLLEDFLAGEVSDPKHPTESKGYIKCYRSMVMIDGKLYSPMASYQKAKNGAKKQLEGGIVLGYEIPSDIEAALASGQLVIEKASENFNVAYLDKKGNAMFKLLKDDGTDCPARFNPYMHQTNLVLNDQFTSAANRPNLVTVECWVPVSELRAGYRAEGYNEKGEYIVAKDPVGWAEWKAGGVAGEVARIKGEAFRKDLLLSRWTLPVRIVPNQKVARMYMDYIAGTDVAIPDNVVPPALYDELKKMGAPLTQSDYLRDDIKGLYESKDIVDEFKERWKKITGSVWEGDMPTAEELSDALSDYAVKKTDIKYLHDRVSKYDAAIEEAHEKELRYGYQHDGSRYSITPGVDYSGETGRKELIYNFSGGVNSTIRLTDQEKAMIRSAVKSGNGKLNSTGIRGRVFAVDRYYLFAYNDNNSITVRLRLDPGVDAETIDVVDREYAGDASNERYFRNFSRWLTFVQGQQRRGNSNHAGMLRGRTSMETDVLDGRSPERNGAGNLQQELGNDSGDSTGSGGIEESRRYSVPSSQDAAYMDAVNSGDMETAQRMVDEAAVKWGAILNDDGSPRKWYHGTDAIFSVFDIEKAGKSGREYGSGFYFTDDEAYAMRYGEEVNGFYLKCKKPLSGEARTLTSDQISFVIQYVNERTGNALDREYYPVYKGQADTGYVGAFINGAWKRAYDETIYSRISKAVRADQIVIDAFRQCGYDGVIDESNGIAVMFASEQIKSAEPVTYSNDPMYDEDADFVREDGTLNHGDPILLSERFDSKKTDVRYSVPESVYFEFCSENGLLTDAELGYVSEAIADINYGNQIARSHIRLPNGQYAIATNRRIVYTDGNFKRPAITKVISFSGISDYDAKLCVNLIMADLSEGDLNYGAAIPVIEAIAGEGVLQQRNIGFGEVDAWEKRRRKESNRRRNHESTWTEGVKDSESRRYSVPSSQDAAYMDGELPASQSAQAVRQAADTEIQSITEATDSLPRIVKNYKAAVREANNGRTEEGRAELSKDQSGAASASPRSLNRCLFLVAPAELQLCF